MALRALIVDDEADARDNLRLMLEEHCPEVEIVGQAGSAPEAREKIGELQPNALFLDIKMPGEDGFALLNSIAELDLPVVFTTAYDEYALKAFKVNALDYLLKPIKKEELAAAVEKARKGGVVRDHVPLADGKATDVPSTRIKRFLIRYGDHFKLVGPEGIAYIHSMQKNTFLRTKEGRDLPLDESLDRLEPQLDPEKFIRLNRQLLVHLHSIKELLAYGKSRVKVMLDPPYDDDAIVSSERSADFKRWLAGN